MDDRVVGDIMVDYSASEGFHCIYVKCKDLVCLRSTHTQKRTTCQQVVLATSL